MNKILEAMYISGVVPVVTVSDPPKAIKLANAILAGGIHVLELPFRVEGAAECISTVRDRSPEIIVGAGTVLTVEQMKIAKASGAMFAVSPGYDQELLILSHELDLLYIPGTISPTDIQHGIKLGLEVIKFFPSEPYGGLSSIDYLSAPFSTVKFLPAGGVGFDNLAKYLAHPAVLACAGGFMARTSHVENGQWEEITRRCSLITEIAKGRLSKKLK